MQELSLDWDKMLVRPYAALTYNWNICHVVYSPNNTAMRSDDSTENITDYESLKQFGWLDKNGCGICGTSLPSLTGGDGSW